MLTVLASGEGREGRRKGESQGVCAGGSQACVLPWLMLAAGEGRMRNAGGLRRGHFILLLRPLVLTRPRFQKKKKKRTSQKEKEERESSRALEKQLKYLAFRAFRVFEFFFFLSKGLSILHVEFYCQLPRRLNIELKRIFSYVHDFSKCAQMANLRRG